MKNSTWSRRNVTVSTHKKSVAMIAFACDRMNSAQLGPVLFGVGSIPAVRRIFQIVDWATR
jgi:hypothetical protein